MAQVIGKRSGLGLKQADQNLSRFDSSGFGGWRMVSMGNVWDRTTEFLSDNFSAVLPIAALAILVPQVLSAVIKHAGPAIPPLLGTGVGLVLLLPVLWGQLTIAALALDPDSGRNAAQSVAVRRIGEALLATVILFGLLLLLAAPIPIALEQNGVDLGAVIAGGPVAQPALSPGVSTFVRLYGVVWLLVAVFVWIRFSVLLLAIVAAEGGVLAALRRSYALSKGIMWKMIGVFLLFGVVFFVAHLAVTSVFGLLFRFIAPGAGPFGVGAIVVAILGGLLIMAYYVVVSAFSANLYRAAADTRKGSAQPA